MTKTPLRQLWDIQVALPDTVVKSKAWYGFFSNGRVYLDLTGGFCEEMSGKDYLAKLRNKIEYITAPDTFLVSGEVGSVTLEIGYIDFYLLETSLIVRVPESQIICFV